MNLTLEKLLLKKILFEKNKKKLIQSFILIVLVVTLLVLSEIFVISMSDGIINRYALIGSGHLQTSVNYDLSNYDFIEEANAVSIGAVLVYGRESTQICAVKGVDTSYFSKNRNKVLNLEKSDKTSSLPSVYISKTLGEQLNLKIDDKIALVADGGNSRIYPKLCYISGIFDSGYKELDQYLIFTTTEVLSKMYKDKLVTRREIVLKDNIEVETAQRLLEKDQIPSIPWNEAESEIYRNLLTSTQTLLSVFLVIALLSGFFVSSVASDIVTSNHRDIAIDKLLGLENKKIKRIYFVAIEFITILSIMTGLILGILFSYLLPFVLSKIALNSIPALSWYLLSFEIIIPFKNLLLICLTLFGISICTVYFSLRRSKKIEPLQLLYTE